MNAEAILGDGKISTNVGGSRFLVTGGAGFIGSHLVERLLDRGDQVVVLDNLNNYYAKEVKLGNIALVEDNPAYRFLEGDIRNQTRLKEIARSGPFDTVVHLAAMAGVRPSLEDPALYMDVNVLGTQNLLDLCLQQDKPPLFVFGSSSSVYGERSAETFSEDDDTSRPVSPYAASKVAGEMLCHAAHKSFGLNVVALRFFTVFGPRQRPDLAIHKFLKLMEAGKPIEVYGDGSTQRDYTFVSDIVDGILAAAALENPGFEVFNLGRSKPVTLLEMISEIEKALGRKAELIHKPMQAGDVSNTFAGIEKARKILGYEPAVSFSEGIRRFVDWHINATGRVKAESKVF